MGKIKAILFLLFVLQSVITSAQVTDRHASEHKGFYTAEELFEKQKYSASQKEFEQYLLSQKDKEHPYYVKAKYYYALNAIYLFQPTAETLLLEFLKQYPETIYKKQIHFELGKYYYRKRKFKDAITWFEKMEVYDLLEEEKAEYYFKTGYANFREDNLKQARNAFYEVTKMESKYQAPALYYYSHISYTEKSYQTALDGFIKLNENPAFKETVPYYIAQIYYLQGKYDKVTEYAPALAAKGNEKYSVGMSHLIGDAFYKVGKYDEAVPFLEEYNNKSTTTRDDDYQLGYAYFKSGDYTNSIKLFDKVTKVKDELAQVSLYHIGEAYLKQDNFLYARNAFELASNMSFDADIEEDALYNYAVLSYKLDYNPFDEAVEALNLYLKKYPNSKRNQDIFQYLVNVYTTMKNYKSAIDAIDGIENKDIRMKSIYQMMAFNYGVELFQNVELNKAIETFKLVKKYPIDPSLNAESYYFMAEAYFKLADYDKAVVLYRDFLKEPGSYSLIEHNDAYYNIAYAYFKQEKWEMAIQSFRTFTQDDSETHKEKITDAFLRIGDCYYKQGAKVDGADDQAILFYQKAIDTKGGQEDYAKFQMGKSYGYKNMYSEKASAMLDIVNNYPKSIFSVPALYEVAESYRLMDKDTKAKQYYNQLIIDYPEHILVQDAVYQIGMLHFRNKEYAQAESHFLRILNEFNDDAKKKEALARLKDVYTALNQPDKYIDLLSEIGVELEDDEKDALFFNNAYDLYEDSTWVQCIRAFNKYLDEFENPKFYLEALYFKGDAHLKIAEDQKAYEVFKLILAKPQNKFTAKAATFVSKVDYDAENYTLAIESYEKLLQAAKFPQDKLRANIGLMRCYILTEDYSHAKPYSENVLKDEQALDYVKTEAHYAIGMALMINKEYDDAFVHFTNVADNSNGAIGAESQYNLALIYNLKEEYASSEKAVRKLMKNNAGYGYWVAKALILQAKNSIGMDDLVQAEYTLNSVLNGYSNSEDGILDEANAVMAILQDLKNKPKSIENTNGGTIEINEGGNND